RRPRGARARARDRVRQGDRDRSGWRERSLARRGAGRRERPTNGGILMSTLTPRRVVELYNDDLWTHKKRELITELLANPLRRHHPGGTQIFSHEDMIRRYDDYHRKFAKISGIGRHYVCEGPFVTLVWDFRMEEASGAAKTISSI